MPTHSIRLALLRSPSGLRSIESVVHPLHFLRKPGDSVELVSPFGEEHVVRFLPLLIPVLTGEPNGVWLKQPDLPDYRSQCTCAVRQR